MTCLSLSSTPHVLCEGTSVPDCLLAVQAADYPKQEKKFVANSSIQMYTIYHEGERRKCSPGNLHKSEGSIVKYYLYARKSSDSEERQMLSIDAQLSELREFALKERLTIEQEFIETQTAKDPGRSVFNSMMTSIESCEVTGIIAWHPDRLARNSIDGGRIIYALDTGKLRFLKFPTFWFEDTPQGKFMLQIAFGQSKYYVDNLSENVRRGLREKVRRGEYPGLAPVGYLNNPRTRNIDINENKAILIRKLFEVYATGKYTPSEVRQMSIEFGLTGHSGKPIALSRIPLILSNPFYIGLFKYKGEIHEGKHESIISRELFGEVQKTLKRASRGGYRKDAHYPFRRLITCTHCGCAITADTQKGHHYYHCGKRRGHCSLKTIREEALTSLLRQSILRVSLSDRCSEWMLAQVERLKVRESEQKEDIINSEKHRLADLQSKIERLLDIYLDSSLTRDEYAARKEQYVLEKTALSSQIAEYEAVGASRFKPVENFISASNTAGSTAWTENLEDLRDFHKSIGSNLRLVSMLKSFPVSDNLPLGQQEDSRGQMSPHREHGGLSSKKDKSLRAGLPSDSLSSAFIPILPDSEVSSAFGLKGFSSLGSKTNPVLQIQYPMPWRILAERESFSEKSENSGSWYPQRD